MLTKLLAAFAISTPGENFREQRKPSENYHGEHHKSEQINFENSKETLWFSEKN